MATMDRPGEFALIERYFRPLAVDPGAFSLLDDAASYTPPPDCDLVLTTDMLVAGVHFFADDPPDLVARKALRVNLSDLAAKGAEPAGYLLSLGLDDDWSEPWLAEFCSGLAKDQEAYGLSLWGGDTVRSPGHVTINITAFGQCPMGGMVQRGTTRPGDMILVTGTIGDGALGLLARRLADDPAIANISASEKAFLVDRYLLPQPRMAAVSAVRDLVHAAMDISDGLAGDLEKMCRASGTGADVFLADIPFSSAAERVLAANPDLLSTAICGGDDYEILLSVDPGNCDKVIDGLAELDVPTAAIGQMTGAAGVVRFETADGGVADFAVGSFSHF